MKFVFVAFVLVAFACGDNATDTPDATAIVDAVTSDATIPDLPPRLIDTGLYANDGRDTLASGVVEYTINFPLWTDNAEKRRFIRLPAGSEINAQNVDFWKFPEGTQVWKQFALSGNRLETRYLVKTGPFNQDWKMVAYIWNAGDTEAAISENGMDNINGTNHDVPGIDDCQRCHANRPDALLGFAGVQLNHSESGLTLASLINDNLISDHVDTVNYDVPGSASEKAVLGYLHGNCGGCHHEGSQVQESITLRLWLTVDSLTSVQDTTIYQSTVGKPLALPLPGVTSLIEAGAPAQSAVFLRMDRRGDGQMPPIGTEQIDTAAVTIIDTWITGL